MTRKKRHDAVTTVVALAIVATMMTGGCAHGHHPDEPWLCVPYPWEDPNSPEWRATHADPRDAERDAERQRDLAELAEKEAALDKIQTEVSAARYDALRDLAAGKRGAADRLAGLDEVMRKLGDVRALIARRRAATAPLPSQVRVFRLRGVGTLITGGLAQPTWIPE